MKTRRWRKRDIFYLAVGVIIILLLVIGILINLPP